MLGIVALVLVVLWLLGFFAFHITTAAIHIILVVALVLVVLHFLRGRKSIQPLADTIFSNQRGLITEVSFKIGAGQATEFAASSAVVVVDNADQAELSATLVRQITNAGGASVTATADDSNSPIRTLVETVFGKQAYGYF